MADFPQIVVGTYEEFVLGYKPKNDGKAKNKYKLEQMFATHSHQASVRCAAANEYYMASSGADEYINIYNMIAMKISKVIDYHNSTVTCLEFTPDRTHLITANQNGDIAIFRCNDWVLVKLWKEAHKNGVTSMSVHPTGSLLITTGTDNIMRFWNLIKGRQAYATNYTKSAIGCSLNFALWSPTGKYYVVCIGKKLEIYRTDTAAVIYTIVANSKITCAAFSKKTLICFGTEEGQLEIHSVIQKKVLSTVKPHKSRIKCMSSFSKIINAKDTERTESFLVTTDSAGVIKLWSVKKKESSVLLNEKAEITCDCRITCLTIVPPKSIKKENKNNEVVENQETSEDKVQEQVDNSSEDINVSKSENLLSKIKSTPKKKQMKNKNFDNHEVKLSVIDEQKGVKLNKTKNGNSKKRFTNSSNNLKCKKMKASI